MLIILIIIKFAGQCETHRILVLGKPTVILLVHASENVGNYMAR